MILAAIDIYRPPLGATLVVIVVGAAALLALWAYLRPRRRGDEDDVLATALTWPQRVVLLLMRLAVLALVAWLLWGPMDVTAEDPRVRPPRVVMLADASASMAQRDVVFPGAAPADAVTRWQGLMETWLELPYLERVHQRADLSMLTFDDSVRMLNFDTSAPVGRHTDLFGAIAQLARSGRDASRDAAGASGTSGGGGGATGGLLVILSDGHDTRRAADPAVIDDLRRAGWRVVGVPVGSGASVPDVAVAVWSDADFLFPGQSTHLNATVSHVGLAGHTVEVDLFHEDQRIDSQRVTLGDEPSQRLRFRITPPASVNAAPTSGDQPVVHAYRIVARPVEGERVTENNQRFAYVQTQRENIRVALFEGQPYWDTRYLAQVLAEDAQIDLTAIYGLGPDRTITVHHSGAARGGAGNGDAGQPVISAANAASLTRAQLDKFDVIILGKGVEQFFDGARAQLLVDFVQQRGGALILARGKPFDDATQAGREAQALLAPIEPVTWGDELVTALSLEVTQAGKADPLLRFEDAGANPLDAIVTRMPDMIAATRIEREKAASIVLLRQRPRNDTGGPAMAAVAHANAGKGKVLAVMTDGLWRWALLPSRLGEFDSVFQVFWSRTVRWLATGGEFLPGQSVSLRLSRLMTEPAPGGEPITVTVATRYADADFKPVLRLIAPSGEVREIALVRASEQSAELRATIHPSQSGVHRVELDAPGMTPARLEARLAVYDQSMERLDPTARPATLHAIADATGGTCLDLSQREELFAMLDAVQQARQPQQREDWAFAQPLVLGAIVLLLGLEWFVRRRNGLL